MTSHRSASLIAVAFVAVGFISAACTRAGGSSIVSDTAPAASEALPSAPEQPSLEPSTIVPPTIDPSEGPSPAASAGPAVTEPPIPEPPAATIAVEGGDPVVGELGSFTWRNSGSDAPWVPGAPIRIGSGEPLTLAFAAPVRITTWTVARTPGATFGSGVVGMGEGSGEPIEFPAPPHGTWSVNVSVSFADNLGSAAYYWLITVD